MIRLHSAGKGADLNFALRFSLNIVFSLSKPRCYKFAFAQAFINSLVSEFHAF